MKKTLLILTMTSVSLLASSCYYDEIPVVPLPETVSFGEDIQPIFNTNCTECHNGDLDPNLTTGNSYNALIDGGFVTPGNAANSTLYKALTGDGVEQMPPSGPLTQDKIDLVKKWINDGALNN